MGCKLYKQGNTHEVRGVMCEAQKFEAHEVHVQLENGWFTSPELAYEEIKAEPEIKHKIVGTLDINKMETPALRLAAKDACIDNWKTARRSTLLNKLKEV